MRVTVVGAGAIGGLIAARLALGGRDVSITSRGSPQGLVLEDASGRHRPSLVIAASPGELQHSEWVVVATKAHDIASAGAWLDVVIGPETVVAVAQNGIAHADRMRAWVPPDRVVPLIVRHGAARPSPGVVRHTLEGSITVPDDPGGRAFNRLAYGCGLDVQVRSDFDVVQWTKLAWNLVGNSLSTIADVPVREIGRRAPLRILARRLVTECAAAAAAEGIELAPDLADNILTVMAGYAEEVRSSMWQDRAAGRRFEHDIISGAVVEVSERRGIEAPYSDAMTSLLASISAG